MILNDDDLILPAELARNGEMMTTHFGFQHVDGRDHVHGSEVRHVVTTPRITVHRCPEIHHHRAVACCIGNMFIDGTRQRWWQFVWYCSLLNFVIMMEILSTSIRSYQYNQHLLDLINTIRCYYTLVSQPLMMPLPFVN